VIDVIDPYLSYLARYVDWRTGVALCLVLVVLPALTVVALGRRPDRSS
jgi:hypothetical protein